MQHISITIFLAVVPTDEAGVEPGSHCEDSWPARVCPKPCQSLTRVKRKVVPGFGGRVLVLFGIVNAFCSVRGVLSTLSFAGQLTGSTMFLHADVH